MVPISLFYCCLKLFKHMNIWMIAKNSMKLHCARISIASSLKKDKSKIRSFY